MKKKKPRHPHDVCKPCWELHYCPYGILVEEFPLSPHMVDLDEIRAGFEETLRGFQNGDYKGREEISGRVQHFLFMVPENWELINEYDVSDLECNVFGHICPVFFVAEGATETKGGRRRPSRYIPRDVMLKVVRRDGQICQLCSTNVRDDELHFDHFIPISRGGRSTVENLRVLCASCNQAKGDSLDEILWKRPSPETPDE